MTHSCMTINGETFAVGDKVSFETSKGIVNCVIESINERTGIINGKTVTIEGPEGRPIVYAVLAPDESGREILDNMFKWCFLSVQSDGWVDVDLEDGHYGCPEYKIMPRQASPEIVNWNNVFKNCSSAAELGPLGGSSDDAMSGMCGNLRCVTHDQVVRAFANAKESPVARYGSALLSPSFPID